jgi:hypothetical protein
MIIRMNDVRKVNVSVRQIVATVFLIGDLSDLTTESQIYNMFHYEHLQITQIKVEQNFL